MLETSRTSIEAPDRLPSLDGLRAVSIILVVGSHMALFTPAVPHAPFMTYFFDGALGVRIFFVISGFIITHLFLSERAQTGNISISRFYLRRFLRLYPVNLAFVSSLYLLTLTTHLNMEGCQFLTALTYTKNFACGGWMDAHLWSLAVEEQFYLVWPIVLVLLRNRGLYWFILLFIGISPFSRAYEYLSGSRLYMLPTSNSDALMIGCALALLCSEKTDLLAGWVGWRPKSGRLAAVLLMYVPTVLSAQLLLAPFTVTFGPMLQAASAGYLIASFLLVPRGLEFSLLNTWIMRSLGLISYSLYIWQQPILLAPPHFFGTMESWLASPLQRLILCIVCAMVSYLLLERPFAALRRRLHVKWSGT
jgi:peptidoglycan/LPS O-acetylase OafA/YrhL